MKVFISWSGELSEKLAGCFQQWLPATLQFAAPYFTPSDVEKGARWGTEIAKELGEANLGVLFLTPQNLTSPWLLYEAGALSKQLEKSKVCPIIFGLRHGDLPAPLRQFQATTHSEGDFKKLIQTINNFAPSGMKLKDGVRDEIFSDRWPRLDKDFSNILKKAGTPEVPSRLEPNEMIPKILELSQLTVTHIERMGGGGISYRAVKDIATSIGEAHEAIQGTVWPDGQVVLNALQQMLPVVRYMVRNVRASATEDAIEEMKKLEELSFKYNPSPDDDVPF